MLVKLYDRYPRAFVFLHPSIKQYDAGTEHLELVMLLYNYKSVLDFVPPSVDLASQARRRGQLDVVLF